MAMKREHDRGFLAASSHSNGVRTQGFVVGVVSIIVQAKYKPVVRTTFRWVIMGGGVINYRGLPLTRISRILVVVCGPETTDVHKHKHKYMLESDNPSAPRRETSMLPATTT